MSARRVVGISGSVTIAMVAATGVLILSGPAALLEEAWGFRGFASLLALAYLAVGALVVLRVPGNRVGGLLLAVALSAAAVGLTVEYAAHALVVAPGSLPFGTAVGWVVSWAWVVFAGLATSVLFLFFPDGRLPSRRWRPAVVVGGAGIILTGGSLAVLPGPIDNAPYLINPLAVPEELEAGVHVLSYAGFLVLAAGMALSAASLLVRFRDSRGVARQQLKWLAAGAVLAGFTFAGPGILLNIVVGTTPGRSTIKATEIATIAGLFTIPAATGIAILRYRLYEIDRLISRTVSWAVLTATLVAVFGWVVVALQGLLAGVTQGQTLAVAASTLVACALFQPIRRRVQAAVDRRFDRGRHDARRLADAFAESVRNEVDLPTLRLDLVRTTDHAVRPLTAGVWLRPQASVRPRP